ncbi:MAG: ABC transporter ATP-binding protein, partial [Chloroflexi bacterium]
MTMLRVRDITVRFGGIVALDHVSLDLNRGEILGMIGPNGAGKTTLFNCISGVIRPDEGSMYFEGKSLTLAPPHVRARMGIARTFQNLQLWSSMTVQENVTVPMDALGGRNVLSDALYLPFSSYAERASSERARAILHVLDLDRYTKTLAGDLPAGIQRRVEIARALAARPHLLL